MNSNTLEKLAILGGEPVSSTPLPHPVFPPTDDETARRINELYRSGNWSFSGPIEAEFSREFAAMHDAKFGVLMANGTVTLQAALETLGVGHGDEVIIPGVTWIATAMAVRYVGAVPVFVDVEESTLCLAPQAFEAAITDKTRAVIPVHLYGSCADMEAILEIARRRNIKVIEDCAHAHGGKWNGKGLGSWGDIGSFSFQQSKVMSAGEGGICITSDEALAERLYRVKHIGYAAGSGQGKAQDGPPAGLTCHNFRATEFQALVLQPQLHGLKERIAHYNRNVAYLRERLQDVSGIRVLTPGRLADPQSFYCLCMAFDNGPLADVPVSKICDALSAEGLPMFPTYGSVYHHILWNLAPDEYRIADGGCPVGEYLETRAAVLIHHYLAAYEATMERIAHILIKVASNGYLLKA